MGVAVNSPVVAVDPGEARIGLAISDPTRSIARPLEVLHHTSRAADAQAILERAVRHGAGIIIIGVAFDSEGEVGPQARRAMRLAEALRGLTSLAVEIWDESGSTRAAQRGKRDDPLLDARAAAVILQEYLDAHPPT
jgi:putative Holliday junction resolvase